MPAPDYSVSHNNERHNMVIRRRSRIWSMRRRRRRRSREICGRAAPVVLENCPGESPVRTG